jgi:hypothetical protein
MGDLRWRLYDDIQDFSGMHAQIVVFPDNNYHHEGVHELLIKGMSVFPSWDPSPMAREIASRYLPLDEYRTGDRPQVVVPSNVVVIWFDRTDFLPLEEQYSSIADACSRAAKHERWTLPDTNLVAHACYIPADSELVFTVDLDLVVDPEQGPSLVWRPMPGFPPEMLKLEVRRGAGEFEYVAHLPPTMAELPIGGYGFDLSQPHTFRLSFTPTVGGELCTATVESPARIAARPAEPAGS